LALPLLLLTAPAIAASSPNSELDQLEMSLYEHSYPNDSQEDRLKRLENMVFGETQKGSDEERLNKLLSITKDRDDAGAAEKPTAAAPPTRSAPPASKPQYSSDTDYDGADNKTSGSAPMSNGFPTASGDADDSNHTVRQARTDLARYPRVTALEQKLLGRAYETDPVAQRLTRLEEKAFGAQTTIQDLSERTDRLEEYAGVKSPNFVPLPGQNTAGAGRFMGGRQPQSDEEDDLDIPTAGRSFGAPGSSMGGIPGTSIPVNGASLEQRVAAMEQQVYGKASEHGSLTHRVEHLEKVVIPEAQKDASANMSLPARVDRLQGALGNNQTPVADAPGTRQKKHSGGGGGLLGGIAKALGGIGGLTMGGMGMGGMGMGSPYGMMSPYGMSPYGAAQPYGYGASPYGMGYTPYGMSTTPYGFGTPMYGGLGRPMYGGFGSTFIGR
jgi:hypothetical protein